MIIGTDNLKTGFQRTNPITRGFKVLLVNDFSCFFTQKGSWILYELFCLCSGYAPAGHIALDNFKDLFNRLRNDDPGSSATIVNVIVGLDG